MTTLTVTTNAPPRRTAPRSPGQSATVKQTSGLSVAYAALPMTVKGGWQRAANILNARHNRAGRHAMSAANAYVAINSARRLCLLPDTQTAPTDFSLPGELPTVNVVATVNSGQFRLCLTGKSYTNGVIVEAANGVAAGKLSTPGSAYVRLCVLPSGLSDMVDITDVYTQVWGQQEEGAQIAVRLTAISAAGVRGVPLEVTGIVTKLPAAAHGPGHKLPAASASRAAAPPPPVRWPGNELPVWGALRASRPADERKSTRPAPSSVRQDGWRLRPPDG